MLLLYQFLIIPLIVSATAVNSSSNGCNRVCGRTQVSYPFGFSDGCEIRLNCSGSGGIMIGGFWVQNLTNDNILVTLPAQCNRSIGDLVGLFGTSYAPTWRNSLLFDNCSEPLNLCFLPNRVRSSVIGAHCVGDHYNVSCYSGVHNFSSIEFLDYGSVMGSRGNCSVFLSSVVSNLVRNGTAGQSIALDLRAAELGWWVAGACDCNANANCTTVNYGNSSGYRCNCNDGFAGDGFRGGDGCQRVRDSGNGVHHKRVSTLVAGIAAGASLMAALILIFYHLKRRSAKLKSKMSAKRLISEAALNCNIPFYCYKEIERATNGFSENQKLGTGAYGTVYAGKLHNNEFVAIKRIRCRENDSSEQVMNEIKLLSSVSHPNLVRLLGWCIEDGEQILVYEFMPNGTLAQHLQQERGGSALPWPVRLKIAAETANAIAYLHNEMSPPIYHRDIKSSNILLDFDYVSKVADFGLSRFGMTEDSHVSTTPQGTPGYVDPQYHQNFHLSDKSDVYSFGVVLVEIITAMKAVDFSRPNSDVMLAALAVERIGKGRIEEIIDPFLEPNTDAWTLSSVHQVAELAFRCLAFHREMRPSMIEVAEELEQIMNRCWDPVEEIRSFHKTESKKVANSPVSVQYSWPSLHSSASTNSLLCNVGD